MAKVPTISVTLTPDLKVWLDAAKAKNPYASVSKLIEQAVLGSRPAPAPQKPPPPVEEGEDEPRPPKSSPLPALRARAAAGTAIC